MRCLIALPNALGDAIMAMPAVQEFARLHPEDELHVLAKPAVAALWQLHAGMCHVHRLGEVLATARALRGARLERAYLLPATFRSALITRLAGIPERIGMTGDWRAPLLTHRLPPANPKGTSHRSRDYARVLGLGDDVPLGAPDLRLTPAARQSATALLGTGRTCVALMPGAARGPAKRWPVERFAALGNLLAEHHQAHVLILGGREDEALGRALERAVPGATSFCGRTSIPEWAALVDRCAAAVTNDSGGMHLAAALGVPTVAIFGATSPERTAPLGPCQIVQRSDLRSESIGVRSRAGAEALARITPAMVYEAVRIAAPTMEREREVEPHE